MAKKPAAPKFDVAVLADIQARGAVTKDNALPLLNANPPLIAVDTDSINGDGEAKATLTDAGTKYLADNQPKAASSASNGAAAVSPYAIITNAVLPPSKRGNKGGGAPTQYPFDALEIGQTFFVPVSEKHPDPVKTLGSTVSSANMRYAEDTGEKREVNRAKRGEGNKAVKDAAGNKVMEKVTVPVYKYTRKFSIRGVVKGETYGQWVAPENGALIARIELPTAN